MPQPTSDRQVLTQVAPGTPLREGLERILRGRTGALIILGYNKIVEEICDGGFSLDVDFSPTKLRELCKMDGAVVLSEDASRIIRANVQLQPDRSLPTVESGTRHRSAERAGAQTGVPVIAVSHSMSVITLYYRGNRYLVSDPSDILARANQAVATLERYRIRLDEVEHVLSTQEIEDYATLRDVATALQRLLMLQHVAAELADSVLELGTEGHLLKLQMDELLSGTEGMRELLIRDYSATPVTAAEGAAIAATLQTFPTKDMIEISSLIRTLGYTVESADTSVKPRGHRLLTRIPRLPSSVIDRLVAHFGALQGLLGATAADLQAVEGIGETRARSIREGLSRLAEAAIDRGLRHR